jgi:transcription-repair coupling factor (superfamily II helicase)
VNFLTELQKSPFIKSFMDQVQKEKSLLLEGLWDSPKAALLHFLVSATKRSVIVLIDGDKESKLFQDLSYFKEANVLELPAWEAFIGEEILPSKDIMGGRLETFAKLQKKDGPLILLAPLKSLLQKVLPPSSIPSLFLKLKRGMDVPFEMVTELLKELGYVHTKLVSDKGEFAVRGGIIDLFPIHLTEPYRVEFFGDTVEQIRSFDPMSQKSIAPIEEIDLSHASEYSLLLKEKNLATLFDYLPNATLVFDDLLKIEDRYTALLSLMKNHPKYFLDMPSILEKAHQTLFWTEVEIEKLSESIAGEKSGRKFYSQTGLLEELSFEIFHTKIATKRTHHPFLSIPDFVKNDDIREGLQLLKEENLSIHLLFDDEREETKLKEFAPLPPNTTLTKGYLSSGFGLTDEKFAIIPFTEFSHRQKIRRTKWRSSYHTPVSEFHAMEIGDLVVHFHNGIGRYLGIEKRNNHLGVESEFLVIEYASDSKLYVPISQSHLVSRYIGTHEEIPQLHQLGTSKWAQTKIRVQKAIIGYAKDLLQMQAEREIKGGFVYPSDSKDVLEFADSFPYTETKDQLTALGEIDLDMRSTKAMDRLICGDVGYGKTEVAMRAAFKAVVDGGKQVAVLVPTTVLAMQHGETFKDRMSLFPIRIGVLSRFQTAKEIKTTLEETRDGKIDILIGTHRIISKDVSFKELGLVIIDEEQRFGVKAKESLKKFKVDADCLTLSATPIPRTLYLSLIGARQMSVINSPPQDRLPIKSILCEKDDEIIKTALLRELSRDGQAYFIHNRVETIHQVAEELQKLVPNANIAVVHGQMDADLLDVIFHRFKQGEIDILVATTIIENGIDISNANTILIDRADTFGISDLYQLRGRVGRWNKAAYCYFLTPKNKVLSEISRKRLIALVETSGFGGGMKLAMRDLEIRGAGDILGIQQSGHASTIGFHLYCKLLKKAVDAFKKKETTTFLETRMEFLFDARLSSHYIPDSSLRLEIYHRLGEALDHKEVSNIFEELKDRFGPPPECVIWLYHMTRLRIFASTHQFLSLKFQNHTLFGERQLSEKVEKKTFFIPPTVSPEELEKVTIKRLTEEFRLNK